MKGIELQRETQAEQLAALFEIGSAILETLDVDGVLQLVCDHAQNLLGAEGACLSRYDPDTEEYTLIVGSGSLAPLRHRRYPSAGSLTGAAIESKSVVIENDLQHSPRGKTARSLAIPSDRAILAPLVVRALALGAIACFKSGDAPQFDEADARLLSAFANLAALAIENARLYQDLQRHAVDLEALHAHGRDLIAKLHTLHDAGVAVSADLDLEALLGRIVEEAQRITGARYGALGVLAADGTSLDKFIARGITPDEQELVGYPPEGRGLLGAVIRNQATIRVGSVSDDDRSVGIPPHHPEMDSFLGTPIRIGQRVFGNLYLANKKDGAVFSEEDALVLEMLADQAAVAIQNAALFEERNRLIQELEDANRVRNRLQAYVNHDVRNALHGIALWAERLSEVGTEGENAIRREIDEIAGKIRRGGEHALRLTSDVLDLTRLEEGRLQTWPRRIVAADVVAAAVDAVSPDADRRGVRIEGDDVPPTLEFVSDPDRVLQIVVNLLSNAVKFSSAEAAVRIRAKTDTVEIGGRPGDWVRISVTDEGPGIAPEDQERIFQGFEQLNPELRKSGMGIGLALSRLLARHLGGDLTVDSRVGSGATFILWLPPGLESRAREGWIG